MSVSVYQRLRILPMLVIVAALCLMVRAGEFVAGIRDVGTAFAQQEVNAQPPPMPAEGAAEETHDETHDETAGDENHAAAEGASPEIPPPPAEGGEKIEWKDSSEADFEYSQVKEDLYKDLVARREELEKRERALNTREALLEASERELDQKIREMTAVRNEIEALMKQQSDEEMERVNSLVKIYEGMKAKDAARIFNTLDTEVLLAVMSRMSERKSAPILAEMDAERARTVTILLAQQKQLPEIPPQ